MIMLLALGGGGRRHVPAAPAAPAGTAPSRAAARLPRAGQRLDPRRRGRAMFFFLHLFFSFQSYDKVRETT
jgi:hypothetical protein